MKYPLLICFVFCTTFAQAQSQEIDEVIEDFRVGIITLESESQWSQLFLHDSITWAMIREGETELVKKFNNPEFEFYSSDPISFYQFLKGKKQQFEEKFYNVNVSSTDQFATVDFLYSFHENGTILNWGKEYWSLLEVKGEWKITSVTWTENWQRITPCPFSNLASFSLVRYKCPPCPFGCDNEIHNKPGLCPICKMELQEIKENKFDGYTKSSFYIQNDSISLFAAYYLPKDPAKIQGSVVIAHGSAPSTHEDVVYYTKLATQLGMAILTYDKRGVGSSSGTYENFSVERSDEWFALLSSDLAVCLEWLRKRPELKHTKMGFLGGSQAGWIMPLAASKSKAVDFIIIGEGAAVSAGEENYFSTLTGDGQNEKYSIKDADRALQNWKGEKGFDPRFILKNLDVNTLWIFGTNDPAIPVDASLRVLKELANPRFNIEILKYGNHDFQNTATGTRYDLIPVVRPWLKEIGIVD